MFDRLRQDWRLLRDAAPGQRFAEYHQMRRGSGHPVRRVLVLAGGVLVVAVGIVLMPAPGPGMVVVGAGGAMLAGESLTVARLLDRCERGLRRVAARWRKRKSKRS